MSPSPQQDRFSFEATADDAGERLDRFLAGRIPDMSRARLKSLIKQGHAASDGRTIVEPNTRVKPGETFEITVPPPQSPVPRGEDIPLDVAFEDEHLIVIDKRAGMVVHPAAGNWSGTLVNALIAHCGMSLSGIGGVKRPGIVHRLDKDTSGLMVVAKTDRAHRALAKQFADHGREGPLQREYAAFVWGVPHPRKGMIDAPLGRKSENRQKRAVVREGGKEAITHYQVMESFDGPETQALASLVPAVWRPGAPIRSGYIWRISAIRLSVTRPMAPVSGPRPNCLARRRAMRSPRLAGKPCMRKCSASPIRLRLRRCGLKAHCRRTFQSSSNI